MAEENRTAYVIRVSNRVRLSQSKVPRDILSLEVSPRLGGIDLRPFVHQATIHSLLGGDPIVSTCTETHALVEVFLPSKVVQPVREKPIGLVSQASDISRSFVRGVELQLGKHASSKA
jgi:hypothetical protein